MFQSVRRLFAINRTLMRYDLLSLFPIKNLHWLARFLLWLLRPFSRTDDRPAPVRIRLALEDLGPIYVKFGQLLSTRRDLLPVDLANELAKLQDDVPPFSNEHAVTIIEQSLGKPLLSVFKEVDSQPLASASVAQVYKAKLLDGHQVIIKVIRPDIRKIIELDIRLMKKLANVVNRFSQEGKRLHLPEVVADYETVIEGELDLKQEAANTSQLRRNFVESDKYNHLLHVPQVHWDYCSEKVLVADFVDGFPISDHRQLDLNSVDRKVLAERGVEIFFTQVFEQNFFHADMHPGNIFVDASNAASPRYVALDCAIMGSLSEEERSLVAKILLAALNREYDDVADLCLRAQWIDQNTSPQAFASIIRSVCEPIFAKPLSEISFGTLLLYLFQAARRFGMDVQPSLVLLQKTLLNVEGLGRDLYPDLDLWSTAQPFLQRWVEKSYSPVNWLEQIRKSGTASDPSKTFLQLLPRSGTGDAIKAQSQQKLIATLQRQITTLTRAVIVLTAILSLTLILKL